MRFKKAFWVDGLVLFLIFGIPAIDVFCGPALDRWFDLSGRQEARRLRCEVAMKRLLEAVNRFGAEHKGQGPAGLEELVAQGYIDDSELLTCPQGAEEYWHAGTAESLVDWVRAGKSSYRYAGPDGAGGFVIVEKAANHRGYRQCLKANGEAVRVKP